MKRSLYSTATVRLRPTCRTDKAEEWSFRYDISPSFRYFAAMKISWVLILFILLLGSCYQPERNCEEFKTGTFTFTTEIDGEEKTTTFIRSGDIEIDFFEGKSDTSSVRWLNKCEYIVKKINPKSMAEEKSIHMKILSTEQNSYTFEYSIVGDSRKSRGTAIKIKP